LSSAVAVAFSLGCGEVSTTRGVDSSGDVLVQNGSSGGGRASKRRVKTVCTTGMVADMVREIGGSHVDVIQLMGKGVDPHLNKATPYDVAKLSSADVVFHSGHHLEGMMADIFVRMKRYRPTVAVGESAAADRWIKTGDHFYDPHTWFDSDLRSEGAAAVCDALVELDRENESR
jgi:manganese/zinc/iron transport system substrate-binding protein